MPQERFIYARGLRIRDSGHLPHWEADDCSYFVTFRLRDSLPREAVVQLMRERERLLAKATSATQRMEVCRAFGWQLDAFLDAGHGSGILREHGGIVAQALKHFDRERYELLSWCVMPNHVHVLLHVPGRAELDSILHSWKSYTAHEIGLGVIWAREYFDRLIRGPKEMEETAAYIRANPEKAGLRNWAFVG
jgi:REP element-mobilizing transposase RayT